MSIRVGDKVPAFSLKDQNGVERSLNTLGAKALVLFFYPKDDTPGCTMEACAFRDQYPIFQGLNAEVWGVSCDGASSHRRFADRHQLPFPLLVDEKNKLREIFGVPRSLIVLPGRVTYVIDKEQIVRLIFNAMLDANGHVSNSKSILEQLGS